MTVNEKSNDSELSTEAEELGRGGGCNNLVKASLLFLNFFLIIMAYYQVKPASRALFIQHWGSSNFPYIWVSAAIVLTVIAPFYNRLVSRRSRQKIVVTSALSFSILMLLFWALLKDSGSVSTAIFYIVVDIMSVALVEQFWSLSNSAFRTSVGKRWYGFIGSGGLLGGIAGGWLATTLIKSYSLTTIDLLFVCGVLLMFVAALSCYLFYKKIFVELPPATSSPEELQTDWETLRKSRYVVGIMLLILVSQVIEPVIEFQFMSVVEESFSVIDERTAYLSTFFSILGAVALGVNLLLTPLVHRFLGVIPGLLIQPLFVLVSSLLYFSQVTLMRAAFLKISDRALSYSINRTSKELLYLPLHPTLIHRVKVWIDMVGYRLFKVIGSVLILLFTKWLPSAYKLDAHELIWITAVALVVWFGVIKVLHNQYQRLAKA